MDDYDNNYIDDGHLGSLDHVVLAHQPQNVVDEAELLAAQAAAEAAAAEQQQHPGDAFNNVGQGLTARYRDMMMQYWQETINSIEHDDHDFKNHQLPLARIKKVMKTDEDVRMISAEAPILFAKGCEVFITELTMRAWIHAEENKRRTLQKSDIAAALTKSDMFDFLIDVVPREEEKPKKSYSQTKSDTYGQQRLPQVSLSSEQAPSTNILGETGQDDVNSHQRAMLQQQLLQQQMLQQQVMGQQHPQHSPQTHQQPQQHHSTHSPRELQHLSQQHQENEGHRSSNSHQIEHHEPHSEPQSRQLAPESVQHEHLVSRNGSANGNNQNSNYEGSFQNFNSGSYGGEF